MRQTVLIVALGAIFVGALAVSFMGLIGLQEGDGLSSAVIQNLQTIALIVVTAVAGLVSHFLGAQSSSGGGNSSSSGGASGTPPEAPSAPGDSGA